MNCPLDVNELELQAAPGALDAPDFLVRSRHEMVRLLNTALEGGAVLSISVMNSEDTAESTLLDVDEPGNRLLLELPPGWRAMTRRHDGGDSLMLTCALDGAKIQFQSGMGEIIEVDDARALSLRMPEFLWRFQRRRDARRAAAGLKITLNLGFADADAQIADLGVGGVGVLICDSTLQLQTGETLRACAITLPGVGQIAVDLTVRHITAARLTDGREVARVGCEFAALDNHTQQLLAHCLETLAEG
jgi:c-di-GMP-binding flagellar brake protein YcgR